MRQPTRSGNCRLKEEENDECRRCHRCTCLCATQKICRYAEMPNSAAPVSQRFDIWQICYRVFEFESLPLRLWREEIAAQVTQRYRQPQSFPYRWASAAASNPSNRRAVLAATESLEGSDRGDAPLVEVALPLAPRPGLQHAADTQCVGPTTSRGASALLLLPNAQALKSVRPTEQQLTCFLSARTTCQT